MTAQNRLAPDSRLLDKPYWTESLAEGCRDAIDRAAAARRITS